MLTRLRALLPPRPTSPVPLAWPLSLIPGPVHSIVLTRALNAQFASHIQNDGFEFPRDRVLVVEVHDARVEFRFCFTGPAGFVTRPATHLTRDNIRRFPEMIIPGGLWVPPL